MSLEASFARLRKELERLQEGISALQVTVAEDKPVHGEAVLVDWLDNTVTDLQGIVEEAIDSLLQAPAEIERDAALKKFRSILRGTHGLLLQFAWKFLTELSAHERIARLIKMGNERGRSWQQWVAVVKTAIERCAAPLRAVEEAILECWHELGEQLERRSVSVQSTNIGQQITLREEQLEAAGKAA